MKILIIGHKGYIGQFLCERLKNHQLMLFDTGGRHYNLNPTIPYSLDIHNQPDLIIHLGSYAYVSEGEEKPYEYFENNVIELRRLLARYRCPVILASSCSVYGNKKDMITEESRLEPINHYGMTKLMQELLVKRYSTKYNILRFFNVTGASGQYGEAHINETHIIPRMIRHVLYGEPLTIYRKRGRSPIREFVDVLKIVDAIVEKIDSKTSTISNVTGQSISLDDLLKIVELVTNKQANPQYKELPPYDPLKLECCPTWKSIHTQQRSITELIKSQVEFYQNAR